LALQRAQKCILREKFFALRSWAARALSCAKKFAAIDRGRVEIPRRDKIYDSVETIDPSAFLQCMRLCAENIVRENLFCRGVERVMQSRVAGEPRTEQLHTKSSGVTVLFSRL
jgi:hypothetical protein